MYYVFFRNSTEFCFDKIIEWCLSWLTAFSNCFSIVHSLFVRWCSSHNSHENKNPITSMYSLRLLIQALRLTYRHQSCRWFPVLMSLAVAVMRMMMTAAVVVAVAVIVAFASLIVVASKSFGFAWAAAVVNPPVLLASFVRSLLQLVLIHGPKHDYYNLWAHSIDSCRALVQTIMRLVFLFVTVRKKQYNYKIQSITIY